MTLADSTTVVWGKEKVPAPLLITRDPGAPGHKPRGPQKIKAHRNTLRYAEGERGTRHR